MPTSLPISDVSSERQPQDTMNEDIRLLGDIKCKFCLNLKATILYQDDLGNFIRYCATCGRRFATYQTNSSQKLQGTKEDTNDFGQELRTKIKSGNDACDTCTRRHFDCDSKLPCTQCLLASEQCEYTMSPNTGYGIQSAHPFFGPSLGVPNLYLRGTVWIGSSLCKGIPVKAAPVPSHQQFDYQLENVNTKSCRSVNEHYNIGDTFPAATRASIQGLSLEAMLLKLSDTGRRKLVPNFGDGQKLSDQKIGRQLAQLLGSRVDLEIIKRLPSANQCRIVNCLQSVIDHESEFARTLESLQHKLVGITGIFPDSLFVQQAKKVGDNPVAGGGFADVWKGEVRGDLISLKVIRVFDMTIDLQKDCYKEVMVWRRIRHPHVMPFMGVNVDIFKPRIALISPWMKNGHMLCYLRENPDANRLKMLYQVALGLYYLHACKPKIIHGDLRANNVLIDDEGCARIGDFGLVRIEDSLTLKSGSSFSGCGSLRWQAPELLCPDLFPGVRCKITEQSDVYAFACVCLEAFTGLPPFPHLREPAVLSEVGFLGKRPSRPDQLGEGEKVTDAIWSVMSSCWSRQPPERPSSSQVAVSLEKPLTGDNGKALS